MAKNKNKIKRDVLAFLRAIGYAAGHNIVIVDSNMKKKTEAKHNSALNPDAPTIIMKIICFAGIPFCALGGRGSGPSIQLAQKAAAVALYNQIVLISPKNVAEMLRTLPDNDERLIAALKPMFTTFESLLKKQFVHVRRMGQFDASDLAKKKGQNLRKKVTEILATPQTKPDNNTELVEPKKEEERPVIVIGDEPDDDIQIIDEPQSIKLDLNEKTVLKLDEAQNSLHPNVKVLRESDGSLKNTAEQQMYSARIDSMNAQTSGFASAGYDSACPYVSFGEANVSNSGPPSVYSSTKSTDEVQCFVGVSSDSDEEEPDEPKKKKKRMSNESICLNVTSNVEQDKTQIDDVLSDFVVVDEWNEDDIPSEEKLTEKTAEVLGKEINTEEKLKKKIYDGENDIESLIRRNRWPSNYEMKIIGVIRNEKLQSLVEMFVQNCTKNALESIRKLSVDAWNHFNDNIQDFEVYKRKMKVRERLLNEIQKMIPSKFLNMHVTGSSINGCGAFNSDIDLCLCYPSFKNRGNMFDDFICDRRDSQAILHKIDRFIKRSHPKSELRSFVKGSQVIPAKVPIIKIYLQPPFEDLDIDININNIAGIYNSHLIHYYSQIDGRFPSLSLLVKHWAIRNDINDSMHGTFNSYSLILMVIHYLQCGVTPAVLPNLQHIFPEKFDRKIPLDDLHLFGDINAQLPKRPVNTATLGELIVGFFHYYASFDFQTYAISIRSAQVFERKHLSRATDFYQIFIEEPFDAINTARCVRKIQDLAKIRRAFRHAATVFGRNKFDLSHINVHV